MSNPWVRWGRWLAATGGGGLAGYAVGGTFGALGGCLTAMGVGGLLSLPEHRDETAPSEDAAGKPDRVQDRPTRVKPPSGSRRPLYADIARRNREIARLSAAAVSRDIDQGSVAPSRQDWPQHFTPSFTDLTGHRNVVSISGRRQVPLKESDSPVTIRGTAKIEAVAEKVAVNAAPLPLEGGTREPPTSDESGPPRAEASDSPIPLAWVGFGSPLEVRSVSGVSIAGFFVALTHEHARRYAIPSQASQGVVTPKRVIGETESWIASGFRAEVSPEVVRGYLEGIEEAIERRFLSSQDRFGLADALARILEGCGTDEVAAASANQILDYLEGVWGLSSPIQMRMSLQIRRTIGQHILGGNAVPLRLLEAWCRVDARIGGDGRVVDRLLSELRRQYPQGIMVFDNPPAIQSFFMRHFPDRRATTIRMVGGSEIPDPLASDQLYRQLAALI